MEARYTGHPVRVTVGTVCTLQLDPPPPRPPRLSVADTVGQTVFALTRLIFGVVYFNDCPQQPYIPTYLLGLALITPLTIPFVTLPCESAQPREHPRGCKAGLMFLLSLYINIWIMAGNWWVFSVYQPNYDPTVADDLYCNKTLYTFAFWDAVLQNLAILVCLAKLCKGAMCGVILTPAPANRDFYRNVA